MDRCRLRVGDIMTKEVTTATSSDTVLFTVTKMSADAVSCVVVVDDGQVTGILTEKDVLKDIAECSADFRELKIAERMSHPVQVVSADRTIIEAGKTMEANGIKHLPVIDDGQLVGIVTQTDITRGMISLSALQYVVDVMTRNVATVDAEAPVSEAARIMSDRNISCLIAMHRCEVAGIVTEKDLLKRVVTAQKDPAQTRVVDVMSFPIVAVPPSYSILSAMRKMETMHLHRLVVMESKKVCGIVTQTDIMRAIRRSFEAMESRQHALVRRLTDLVQCVIPDQRKLQEFLDHLQDHPVGDVRGEADTSCGL
jgi:CBS domain-containing protein